MAMQRTISESDWKQFSKLRLVALERFCQRVLSEIAEITSDASRSSHDRYGAVYTLIEKRDKQLAKAFDDPRRSAAFFQLANICRLGLISDEEIAIFGSETREALRMLTEM